MSLEGISEPGTLHYKLMWAGRCCLAGTRAQWLITFFSRFQELFCVAPVLS